MDSSIGGKALFKANSDLRIDGNGFLPIYDSANDGYRVLTHTLQELGTKPGADDNTVRLGFRLALDNAEGYRPPATAR